MQILADSQIRYSYSYSVYTQKLAEHDRTHIRPGHVSHTDGKSIYWKGSSVAVNRLIAEAAVLANSSRTLQFLWPQAKAPALSTMVVGEEICCEGQNWLRTKFVAKLNMGLSKARNECWWVQKWAWNTTATMCSLKKQGLLPQASTISNSSKFPHISLVPLVSIYWSREVGVWEACE